MGPCKLERIKGTGWHLTGPDFDETIGACYGEGPRDLAHTIQAHV